MKTRAQGVTCSTSVPIRAGRDFAFTVRLETGGLSSGGWARIGKESALRMLAAVANRSIEGAAGEASTTALGRSGDPSDDAMAKELLGRRWSRSTGVEIASIAIPSKNTPRQRLAVTRIRPGWARPVTSHCALRAARPAVAGDPPGASLPMPPPEAC